MNTKIIMTASAVIFGLISVVFTFIPAEFLAYMNFETSKSTELFLQVFGALYFAFALLNWMTRYSMIGGIYNRPIALANFSHFVIAGLALIKGINSISGLHHVIWLAAFVYSIFAVLFGFIAFKNPRQA